MLNLSINHNIFLTRDQRYALHGGIDLVVVGFAVPVWFTNKTTSEPAKEVFCKYYLKNNKRDLPLKVLKNGFEIHLPFREGQKPEITDEQWRLLNNDPLKLEEYYKSCISETSSKCLLDVKDGGSKHLFYREHNKIQKNEESFIMINYVCMEDMEELNNSLCGTIL